VPVYAFAFQADRRVARRVVPKGDSAPSLRRDSQRFGTAKTVNDDTSGIQWNLIVLQGAQANTDPTAVFDTNIFRAVWTFDNQTGDWSQYGRAQSGLSSQNQIKPLASVGPGKAYWVYYDRPTPTNWSIAGFAPTTATSLSFREGWNLIGVPADASSADINILSIFRPGDLSKIQFIARWEAATQRMQLYDPRNAAASEFQLFNPNLGHWIHATETAT
jgi:hypothetical protein